MLWPRMVSGLDHGRRSGFPILRGGRGGLARERQRRRTRQRRPPDRRAVAVFKEGGSAMVPDWRERYGYRLQCGREFFGWHDLMRTLCGGHRWR